MKRTSLKPPGPHRTRAFISYSHADREYGGQVKAILESFGFEAFLAHEDLELSTEWRDRVLEELGLCELFIPLLSTNFVASQWASQEIGFIISRPPVVVAPLSLDGTRPYGFISHLQSRPVPKEGVTAPVLIEPLARRLPRQILPFIIYNAAEAQDYRSAEARMRPLMPLFGILTPTEAQMLALGAVENGQIWYAKDCREAFLPELIRMQRDNIEPSTLRALAHQIEHGEWYPGE